MRRVPLNRGLRVLPFTITAMKTFAVVLMVALCAVTGCNKSAAPAGSSGPAAASPKSADAVQRKLLENSGSEATDCGRLDVHSAEAQLKTASDCAMQAAQAKRAFYVAYDMPGMSVGVAGNAEGKLFTVQSQSAGAAPALTSGLAQQRCGSHRAGASVASLRAIWDR